MDKVDKNELQKTESPLMAAASLVQKDGNMDVSKLKELLDLQERWEANEAKKAYVRAMATFKANPPIILKDRNVKYQTTKGVTDYNHATLSNVTTCINKALSEHGLTASWVTGQDNNAVKVTCKITHVMGHSEETCLSAPPDATGSKNVIQAIGSTVTYLQRYTILALTGLATCDQDDDGVTADDNKPPLPKFTSQNKKVLDSICAKLKKSLPVDKDVDRDRVAATFLAHYGTYPSKMGKVDEAVNWIIGLKREETWTKENGASENTHPPQKAESDAAGTEAGSGGSADENTIKVMTEGCCERLREVLSATFSQISILPETIVAVFCKLCSIVLGGDELDYTMPGSLNVDKLTKVKKQIEDGIPQKILDAFEPDPVNMTEEELEEHSKKKLETYYRYICKNLRCLHGFNELSANGNCPKCLRKDITDNGPESTEADK